MVKEGMAVIAGLSLPVLLRAKNEFALAAESLPSRKSAMWDLYSFLASAKFPKLANPSLSPAEMVCKRLPENGGVELVGRRIHDTEAAQANHNLRLYLGFGTILPGASRTSQKARIDGDYASYD